MAEICERQKLADKAAKYWEKFVQIVDQDGMVEEKSTGHTRAYIYLSRYYLDLKDFQNVDMPKNVLDLFKLENMAIKC